MSREVWSLLLAAGGSRRLGRPKQLVRMAGEPLILRQARTCLALTPGRCVVVVGAGAHRSRAALGTLPVQLTHARDWRAGQARSLAAGIRALPRSATACLVVLVDQWTLEVRDLARLLAAARRTPRQAVASAFTGRLMAPAVFPRRLFPALTVLEGDRGARDLLRELQPPALGVPFTRRLADLDTPRDLAIARRRYRRQK